MTKEDVLKWCERGNHEFRMIDSCVSVKGLVYYQIQKCDNCPAMRVERF